jgi:hypothetical protein
MRCANCKTSVVEGEDGYVHLPELGDRTCDDPTPFHRGGVVKHAFMMQVPRELLLDAGVVEPTPEERAAMDRRITEARLREAERAEQLEVARRELADVSDPLARAVLGLHAENERGECEGCDVDGYEAERPEWPCRTVAVVAAHYGIRMGLT